MGVPAMAPHPAMGMPAPAPAHYGTPYSSAVMTPEPTRPRKSGSGLIIALAAIALLLGAGAVVAYVMGTQPSTPTVPPPIFATATPTTPTTPAVTTPTGTTPVAPVTPLTTSTVTPTPPNPNPTPVVKKDAGAQAQPDAGAPQPPIVHDAGSGQTTITTPFGTFQFPGPRPPFYPENQPWPPPTIGPLPGPPQ